VCLHLSIKCKRASDTLLMTLAAIHDSCLGARLFFQWVDIIHQCA
jgi:hypothetical protein